MRLRPTSVAVLAALAALAATGSVSAQADKPLKICLLYTSDAADERF